MNVHQANTGVVVLALMLPVCLLIVYWYLIQGQTKPKLDMNAVVRSGTLTRRHQKVELSVINDNATISGNATRLPALAAQSQAPTVFEPSSAFYAFATRQVPSAVDAAQAASDMNDAGRITSRGHSLGANAFDRVYS